MWYNHTVSTFGYNKLNSYYKNRFGERVLKICVDAGFTCPNRDGTKGSGGCVFCSEKGSGELIKPCSSIESQVQSFLDSYRGQRANKFIVYFQNFTNTYADVDTLKSKYDSALCSDKIIGLSVATRPDCISEDVCKLLASYKPKYYVSVELGLQTANDDVGNVINRCYTTSDFISAVHMLKKYDIEVVSHIMVGLPNEKDGDIVDTVHLLNSLHVDGVKIHSTYVVKNTALFDMYNSGIYSPISMDYYIDKVIYILTHLDKNIVVHRIVADAPKDILVAPLWNKNKKIVLNKIDSIVKNENISQGMYLTD